MEVTNLVATQRNESLLTGDYGSYRQHLTRRLLTLRRHLGRTSAKGKKFVSKTPVTAEDVANNSEFVDLLLITAERAWAHAMYMKSMHTADAADKAITGSTKKHIISRLRRAVQQASHLVAVLHESSNDAIPHTVKLEALAYESMLKGTLSFEAQKWERSLATFSEAYAAYSALLRMSKTGKGDNFQELLSSTVEPSIRYAAYQVRLPRTQSLQRTVLKYARQDTRIIKQTLEADPSALSEAQTSNQQQRTVSSKDIPKTITWRQRTVPLEDASIAEALAAVTTAEATLHKTLSDSTLDTAARAAAYDAVLNPSQDAVDATSTALAELASEGVSTGDPRMQALQITRTATNYALVGWRVGRNRVLCGRDDGARLERFEAIHKKPRTSEKKLKDSKVMSTSSSRTVRDDSVPQDREVGKTRLLNRLRERIALYDSTLQSLDSVRSLPGVAADSKLLQELTSRRAYFGALRCCNVAHSHALLLALPEALALYARSLALAQTVVPDDSGNSATAPNLEVSKQQAEHLLTHLQALTHEYRGRTQLAKASAKGKTEVTTANLYEAWAEHLNEFPEAGKTVELAKLVDYPARLRPVPVKPIFLDLAWNYIEYPSQRRDTPRAANPVERTREGASTAEERAEERRGWFSSWRR